MTAQANSNSVSIVQVPLKRNLRPIDPIDRLRRIEIRLILDVTTLVIMVMSTLILPFSTETVRMLHA
jgi:MarR-like DNA-binding transcriptional regulator SgrR of sgrS sRNA